MHKLVAVASMLSLVACVAESTESGESGYEVPPGSGSSAPELIAASTTWTGIVDVSKQTVVAPGVTLTIAAGTAVRLAENTSIVVQGTVDVQGRKASVVQLTPAIAGRHHYGFTVSSGGELKMSYGVQIGGGISVNGGKITVSDSLMSRAPGDFLVVGDGTVDVTYSSIGLESTESDSTHCDLHFGGRAATIKITHTNISTSPYGLMLYGGSGVDLTYNNWFSNGIDIETMPGVRGDVSNGWFAKGTPTAVGGATLVANSIAAERLVGAGPR